MKSLPENMRVKNMGTDACQLWSHADHRGLLNWQRFNDKFYGIGGNSQLIISYSLTEHGTNT